MPLSSPCMLIPCLDVCASSLCSIQDMLKKKRMERELLRAKGLLKEAEKPPEEVRRRDGWGGSAKEGKGGVSHFMCPQRVRDPGAHGTDWHVCGYIHACMRAAVCRYLNPGSQAARCVDAIGRRSKGCLSVIEWAVRSTQRHPHAGRPRHARSLGAACAARGRAAVLEPLGRP